MLTPKPRSLTLKGSASDIARNWDTLAADLTSGDLIVLAPAGGVLEVDQPLTISGDVTVTGLGPRGDAAGDAGAASARRLLGAGAPGGATTVKCIGKAGTAFRVM